MFKRILFLGLLLHVQFVITDGELSIKEIIEQGKLDDLKRFLHDFPSSVNDCNEEATPLMLAVRYGHLEMVKLLLDAGANPHITPKGEHNTALRDAVRLGFDSITRILLDRCYSKPYRRQKNFQNSSEPIYNKISSFDLENGADNYERSLGFALVEAVMQGRKDLIRILYDKGAHPNILCGIVRKTPGGHVLVLGKTTALIEAIKKRDQDMVKLLLDIGADIELGPMDSHYYIETTPLIQAVKSGSVDMVKYLLAKGANRYCSVYGQTAYDIARDLGYADMCSCLY